MKKVILLALLIVLLVASLLVYDQRFLESEKAEEVSVDDIYNSTFLIDGEEFKLENGLATKSLAPESSFLVTLRVFGTPVYGDLDKDGDEDAALWLQYEPGGSGVFYYAVLMMRESNQYSATDTLFLGDRIAPQSLQIEDGRAVYNFAERGVDESFAVPPSIGKSVYVHFDVESGEVGEWVKDFEGESNPTEVFRAQVDRVSVVFENYDYTSYRLITNGQVHEGELNTERGFGDDINATVYVLDWQKPEGEQKRYVRLTNDPGKIYLLDGAGAIIKSGALMKD